MSDTGSRMEVCPYCKKPFKRLKSHLPHCKVIGPDTAVSQVYHSKPAIPPRTKKEKRPIKDLTKARRELETENESRNTKLISDRPGWTVRSFPPLAVGLERAGTRKADKEIKDPHRLPFPTVKHSEPEKTSQGEIAALSRASVTTSPKAELVKDVPKSEASRCGPSETGAALLVGAVEPSSSNEARKHASLLPGAVQASSPNRTLDTVDLQRQGLLAKSQDVPISNSHSAKNLSSGVQRERAPVSGKENSSRGGGHLPGASTDPGPMETLERNSKPLVVGLHTNLLSELQFRENPEKEFGLRVKCGSEENAQKSVSSTGMLNWVYVDSHHGDFTEEKPQDDVLLKLSTSQEAAHRKLLSASRPRHQSLSPLAVKSLQGEKTQFCGPHQASAVTLSGESKEQASLGARSACQPQALQVVCQPSSYSAQHLSSKTSPVGHAVAADTKALPISLGLEWFPELYPSYVGLGVLPRTPQHWNLTAQMAQLASPRGESFSQASPWGPASLLGGMDLAGLSQRLLFGTAVPGLERSSADGRSLEAPMRLTASTFPLMRLLGAVHKGWVRCSTTVRKSGVGAITMLFVGSFVLGCSWSFRHLSKPARTCGPDGASAPKEPPTAVHRPVL